MRFSFKTAQGDVELEMPKPRRGTYYPESILSRGVTVDTLLDIYGGFDE